MSVEFDHLITDQVLPDDPRAADLWGLLGPGDGSDYGIDATTAWATTDGDGVVVAVVDSGLAAHEDLAGQSVPGYDMVDRDSDATDPMTGCPGSSHGTLVAGPIAAIANNGIGVFGGAHGAKIQPVRVSQCGRGWTSDAADAIRWAGGGTVPGVPINPTPAKVINASFSALDATMCLPEFASAIADARSRGAVIVVSAANEDSDAMSASPANCPGVLTVGAIDEDGKRSSFSNYGSAVELTAPGNGIWTTAGDGGYGVAAGTSLSAPHVAAGIALVRSAFPGLTNDAVEVALMATALPVAPDASPTGCAVLGCGAGIVNPAMALQRLAAGPPLVGRISPSTAFPFPTTSVTIDALVVMPQGVAAAEVRVGSGSWQALTARDGAYGGAEEWVRRSVTAPAAQGTHAICVRGFDGTGGVGEPVCTSVLVDAGAPTLSPPSLSASAADPGTAVTVTASATDFNALRSIEYRIGAGPWIPARASDGAYDEPNESTAPTVNHRVESITVGGNSCALLAGGNLRCWGPNATGFPGDGTVTHSPVPVEVGLTGVQQVSSGGNHACALLQDRTVRCWGMNSAGQLGDGTTRHRATPVVVTGLDDVRSVSAGTFHTCAVRMGGDVWCWGAAIGLGDGSTSSRTTAASVPGLTGVEAVTSGGGNFGSSCAHMTDGTLRCWGDNSNGSIGDGTTVHRRTPVVVEGLANVVEVSGYQHCTRHADGSARCWGSNGYGELGDGTTTHRLEPTLITVASGIQDLSAGGGHTCAVIQGGGVRCWGNNNIGQLGDGTWQSSVTARTVVGLAGIADVAAAYDKTCAADTGGRVYCWGLNEYGQLGDGSTTLHFSPVRVAGVGPLSSGPHSICVRATDIAGRTSNGSACATLTVSDTDAPKVVFTAPTSPVGNTFTYALAFDEAVTGLIASDFVAASTPGGICAVSQVSGSGATYTVHVGCTASGSFSLSLKANAVVDASANPGPIAQATTPTVQVQWTAPPPVGSVSRQSGANRYATAAAVSKATYPTPGVPVAFVASGLNFPDALAGAAAAGRLGGPLLLVTSSSIPPETAAELNRLDPRRIVVLGGTGVVSAGVAAQLDAYLAP